MKTYFAICLLCLSQILTINAGAPSDELIFVTAVVRHGVRRMMNQDYMRITNNSSFLREPGRLTNVGKHQLYLYGRQLADLYMNTNKLLSIRYNPYQITIRSSGVNRTIESAQSLIAGLYQHGTGPALTSFQIEKAVPPIKVSNLNEIQHKLRDAALPFYMRTVPVHTSSPSNDFFFSPYTECDALTKYVDKPFTKGLAKINDQFTKFYEYFTKKYKITVGSMDDCYRLYDNIVTLKANAIPMNVAISPADLSMLKVIAFENNIKNFTGLDLQVKLIGHVILTDVKNHFARAVADSENSVPGDKRLRMAIMQISDSHILALNKLFALNLTGPVEFASAVIFELHKHVDSYNNVFYRVKAFYNGEEVILHSNLGKYDEFMRFLHDNTYTDDEDFMSNCMTIPMVYFDRETYVAVAVILFLSLIILWLSNWFILTRKPEQPKEVDAEAESTPSPLEGINNTMLESGRINEPSLLTPNEEKKSES